MTTNCGKWLKTAIDGGNLWSTALQLKDDDDDDDDNEDDDDDDDDDDDNDDDDDVYLSLLSWESPRCISLVGFLVIFFFFFHSRLIDIVSLLGWRNKQ